MISDFAQYPNQPGTSLNVDNINYATLRMQEALQRLQNMWVINEKDSVRPAKSHRRRRGARSGRRHVQRTRRRLVPLRDGDYPISAPRRPGGRRLTMRRRPSATPAGMTRLDQSQVLVGIQPAYGVSRFDKGNDTTVSGGNGGNALGFIPGLGGYYVYSATPDLKFGISLGSNFGLSAEYQNNWSGRFYGTKSELITLGAFRSPPIG